MLFPIPEESPAHHVKELRIWIAGQDWVPERFFEYTPCFANAETVRLLGYGGVPPLRVPSLWKLPQSVTSLIVNSGVVSPIQIRDIMAQLPNLEDLSLLGSLIQMDKRGLMGIGTVLTGRFLGKLLLRDECADKGVLNMLLQIPTGLHFTEVDIRCTGECLLSTVKLVGVCGRTLVKLSCTVTVYGIFTPSLSRGKTPPLMPFPDADSCIEDFERSFDFSKLPNLQEAKFTFRAGRIGGGLLWMPMALSTLRPTTSPRISTIRLYFARSLIVNRSVLSCIEGTADDLRRVADEVARIEREFEGAVSLTTARDSVFKVVLDTLNVRLCFCGVDDIL